MKISLFRFEAAPNWSHLAESIGSSEINFCENNWAKFSIAINEDSNRVENRCEMGSLEVISHSEGKEVEEMSYTCAFLGALFVTKFPVRITCPQGKLHSSELEFHSPPKILILHAHIKCKISSSHNTLLLHLVLNNSDLINSSNYYLNHHSTGSTLVFSYFQS